MVSVLVIVMSKLIKIHLKKLENLNINFTIRTGAVQGSWVCISTFYFNIHFVIFHTCQLEHYYLKLADMAEPMALVFLFIACFQGIYECDIVLLVHNYTTIQYPMLVPEDLWSWIYSTEEPQPVLDLYP